MTFSDVIDRRALCGATYDTVLALGGSASYLGKEGIEALRDVARRKVLVTTYGFRRFARNRRYRRAGAVDVIRYRYRPRGDS